MSDMTAAEFAAHRRLTGLTYDELSEDQVKELSDAVNALSEPLSKIAGVILA